MAGEQMSDLILLRPWLIGVALFALGLILWRILSDKRVGHWNAVIDPHLMNAMTDMGRISGQGWRDAFRNPLLWAFILALPALASPALNTRAATAFRNFDGVVLVVDISPSVTQSGALRETVIMARSILQSIGSRPAGLIIYAGDAYTASELTTDTGQIEFTLELLDADTIPDQGSRPALGLERAIALLNSSKTLRSDIVWLTDGGGLDEASIATLSAQLVRPDTRVTIVHTGADPAPKLGALARSSQASLFTVDQINAATAHMATINGQTLRQSDLRLLSYREIGPWFLIPAALLLLAWFRRPA